MADAVTMRRLPAALAVGPRPRLWRLHAADRLPGRVRLPGRSHVQRLQRAVEINALGGAGARPIRIVRGADGTKELVRQIAEERRETSGSRSRRVARRRAERPYSPQLYVVELYARLDGSDRTEQWDLTTIMFRS